MVFLIADGLAGGSPSEFWLFWNYWSVGGWVACESVCYLWVAGGLVVCWLLAGGLWWVADGLVCVVCWWVANELLVGCWFVLVGCLYVDDVLVACWWIVGALLVGCW